MAGFMDLSAELRNYIYDAILATETTVRVKQSGHVIEPQFARVNRQIRLEILPMFAKFAASPGDVDYRAVDFHIRALHDFVLLRSQHFDGRRTRMTVKMELSHPLKEADNYESLLRWLKDCEERQWDVRYQASFNWSMYTLSDAIYSCIKLEKAHQSRNLPKAMRMARIARVKAELVDRPARELRVEI